MKYYTKKKIKFKNHEKVYHLKEKRVLEVYNHIDHFCKDKEIVYKLVEYYFDPSSGVNHYTNPRRIIKLIPIEDTEQVISMHEYRKLKIEELL